MGRTGTQVEEITKRAKIPEEISVFTLQGVFDLLDGLNPELLSTITASSSLHTIIFAIDNYYQNRIRNKIIKFANVY